MALEQCVNFAGEEAASGLLSGERKGGGSYLGEWRGGCVLSGARGKVTAHRQSPGSGYFLDEIEKRRRTKSKNIRRRAGLYV